MPLRLSVSLQNPRSPLSAPLFALIAVLLTASPLAARDDVWFIDNVTLIDGRGGTPVSGAAVVVEGERIHTVSAVGVEPPPGALRIDGSGKYLIPGLMDMHIHLRGRAEVTPEGLVESPENVALGIRALHSYLYAGVTAVFDAGNVPEYIFSLRDKERSGALASPRIFATGGIVTYPGSHGSSAYATLVDSWPAATEALAAHAGLAPDIVKLTYEERGWGARPMIPMLPVDLMQHIIEFYNDRGIRSTVHASSEYRARQAIFAGVDSLAHPVIQGPVSDSFARLMGAKKIPMVTTLTIGENYSRLAEHPEYLDQTLYQATLTEDEIETLKTVTRKAYQQRKWTWWMKIMTGVAQENLATLYRAGAVLVAGTDQSSGPALHRELELLAEAGIPPSAILRMATLNGAIFLGREQDLGSIEPGKLADMVLLNADPTADIRNARRISTVIKGGERIDLSLLKLPVNGQ